MTLFDDPNPAEAASEKAHGSEGLWRTGFPVCANLTLRDESTDLDRILPHRVVPELTNLKT
jgi:hypothetical protein